MDWKLYIVVSLIVCTGKGLDVFDNQGREFIVAFMENDRDEQPLELFVTTYVDDVVTVSINAPNYNSSLLSEQIQISKGETTLVNISLSLRMSGSGIISPKGILIEASDEVAIYGVNRQMQTNDAFLGLPTDVLGQEYYAVCFYPTDWPAQFMVVATMDDTIVEITVPDNSNLNFIGYEGNWYGRGDTFSLTMDTYEVFQVKNHGDLTGTFIKANQPVAFFSGNKRTTIGPGGSSDHLVEQLVSVDRWGKHFVVVPIPQRSVGDYYKIVASVRATNVEVNCTNPVTSEISAQSYTLVAAGSFELLFVSDGKYCSIVATEAILVVQFVLSQVAEDDIHDPAMLMIPPVEQYGADYTFTTPKFTFGVYENFFMFVVKDSEKDGLRVDGLPFPENTSYVGVPDTDKVAGYIVVSDGYHTVYHISPTSVFGGFLYGRAQYETYGFPVGMRMAEVNKPCIRSVSGLGDGIDNDCDGLIDEELCTEENGQKDDDRDGESDEDCAMPRPVDGNWADWTEWGACSQTCVASSAGTKLRVRMCTNPSPKYQGSECVGESSESTTCTSDDPCPVPGGWATWDQWSTCSVTCNPTDGSGGSQYRSRTCTNPEPQEGGDDCAGDSTRTRVCTVSENCPEPPIDGDWSDWGEWGACSVTCNVFGDRVVLGTRSRSRSCTDPEPQNGGVDCIGDSTGTEDCTSSVYCPVNGNWGTWEAWGSCIKIRAHVCDNPAPAYGGQDCAGSVTESAACDSTTCPTNIPTLSPMCDCQDTSVSPAVSTTTLSPEERQQELQQYLADIKSVLKRDKKSTSKYQRSLSSAADDRTSSKLVGYVAVAFMSSLALSFFFMDIGKFYRDIRTKKSDVI